MSTASKNAETPVGVGEVKSMEILGLDVVDLASEFFAEVAEGYKICKDLNMFLTILQKPESGENHTLMSSFGEGYKKLFNTSRFIIEDDLL